MWKTFICIGIYICIYAYINMHKISLEGYQKTGSTYLSQRRWLQSWDIKMKMHQYILLWAVWTLTRVCSCQFFSFVQEAMIYINEHKLLENRSRDFPCSWHSEVNATIMNKINPLFLNIPGAQEQGRSLKGAYIHFSLPDSRAPGDPETTDWSLAKGLWTGWCNPGTSK